MLRPYNNEKGVVRRVVEAASNRGDLARLPPRLGTLVQQMPSEKPLVKWQSSKIRKFIYHKPPLSKIPSENEKRKTTKNHDCLKIRCLSPLLTLKLAGMERSRMTGVFF